MKVKSLVLFLLLFSLNSFAQTTKVSDYKIKNNANGKDRSEMLDAFRESLYKDWKLRFEFFVKYFKVSGNYAWFEATAVRKDGKDMAFEDDSYDCCHAEALFKKQNGKWTVLEGAAFSTDLWYDGINKRHPEVPAAIFPKEGWVR